MTLTEEQKKRMMIEKHLLKDVGNGEWLVRGCSEEDWFSSIQTPTHFDYYVSFWSEHVESPENAHCEVFVDYYKDILGTVKKSRSQLAAEKVYHAATTTDDEWILDFKGAKVRRLRQPKLFDWLLLRRQLSLGNAENEHPSVLPAQQQQQPATMHQLKEEGIIGVNGTNDRWVLNPINLKKLYFSMTPKAASYYLRYWIRNEHEGARPFSDLQMESNGVKSKSVEQLIVEEKMLNRNEVIDFNGAWIAKQRYPVHFTWYVNFWKHDLYDDAERKDFVHIENGLLTMEELEYQGMHSHHLLDNGLHPWVKDIRGNKIYRDDNPAEYAHLVSVRRADLTSSSRRFPSLKRPANMTDFSARAGNNADVAEGMHDIPIENDRTVSEMRNMGLIGGEGRYMWVMDCGHRRILRYKTPNHFNFYVAWWRTHNIADQCQPYREAYEVENPSPFGEKRMMQLKTPEQMIVDGLYDYDENTDEQFVYDGNLKKMISSFRFPNHVAYWYNYWSRDINNTGEMPSTQWRDVTLFTGTPSLEQLEYEGKLIITETDRQILNPNGAFVSEQENPEEFNKLLMHWTAPTYKNPSDISTFNSKLPSSLKTFLKNKAACMEFLLEHHRFGTDAVGQRWVSERAFGKKIFEVIHPAAFRRILKEELNRCRNERVQFGKAIPYVEPEVQVPVTVQEEPLNNFLTEDIEPLPLTEEDRLFLQGGNGDNVLETGWWHDWENEEVNEEENNTNTATPLIERALYDAHLNENHSVMSDDLSSSSFSPLKEKIKKKVKSVRKVAPVPYIDRMRALFAGEAPRPRRFNMDSGQIEEIPLDEEGEAIEETLLNTAFFVEETEEESEAIEDFIAAVQVDEEQSALAYSRNLELLREWGVAGRDEEGEFVYDCPRQKQIYRNEFPLHYAYYEQHWLNNLKIHPINGNFTVDEEAPCDAFVATKVDENGRVLKTFEQLEFENHAGYAIFSGATSGQRMMLHAGFNFLKYITDFNGQRIPYIPQFIRHVEAYFKIWAYGLPPVPFIDVDSASGLKTDIQLVIEGYIEASYENGNLHFMTIKAPMSEDGRPFVFWLMPSSFMEKVKDFWKTHEVAKEGDTMVDTIVNENGQMLRSMEQLQHDHNARLFEYAAGGSKILKKQWVKTETGVLGYNEDGSNAAEFDEYLFRWQRQLDMRDFLLPSNKRRLLDTGRIHFNASSFKMSFGAAREMEVDKRVSGELRIPHLTPVSFKKKIDNTGKMNFTAKSSPLPILKVESEEEVEEEVIPPVTDRPIIWNNREEIIARAERRRNEAQEWVRSLYEQPRAQLRFVEQDTPTWMRVENYSQNVYQPFVLPEEHSTYTPFYENSNSGMDTLINWWGSRQQSIHFGKKRLYEEISNDDAVERFEDNNEQETMMTEGQFQRFQHMLNHAFLGSDDDGRTWVLDCNADHPNKIFIDERPHLFNYYLNYWTNEENEHVTMEQCIDRIDDPVPDATGNVMLRSMAALEHEDKHGIIQVHENGADFTDNWVIDFRGNRISSFPFTNHYNYYLQFWREHPGDTPTHRLAAYIDREDDGSGHLVKTIEQVQFEGKANILIRSSNLLSADQRRVLMWVLDFQGNKVYMFDMEDDAFKHYLSFWLKDVYNTMPRVPYAPEGISRLQLIQMGLLSNLEEKRQWVQSLTNGRVYEDELPAHFKFYLEQWLSGSGIHEKKNYMHLQQLKLHDGSSLIVKTLGQLQFEGKMSFPSRETERLYEKWVVDFNGDRIDIWPYPAHYAFYLNYWRRDIHDNPDRPAPFVDLFTKTDGTSLKTMQQLQMDGVIQLFRHDMTNADDPSFHIINARMAKQEWVRDFHGKKLFYGEVSKKEFKYYVKFYMEDVDGVKERVDYAQRQQQQHIVQLEQQEEEEQENFSLKLKTPHLPLELKKGIGKRKGKYNMDTVRLGEELEEWGVAGIDILKDGGEPIFWVLDREGNRVEKNNNVKLFNKMLRYWSDRRNPIVVGKGSPVEYTTDEHGERIKSIAQLAKEHKHSEEGEGRVWVASFTPVRIYLNYAPRHYYYYRSFWQHDLHDDKERIPFVDIINNTKSMQQLEYEDKAFHVLLPDPEEEVLFPKRDLAQVDWVRDFNGQKIFADVDPERFDFYLDFWKRDVNNDLPQIAPSEYTTFNGKITSTVSSVHENDNVARLIKFGFMGVNHLGQPWVRDCDDRIILKDAFPEHFAFYAKRDPFAPCSSFKKYSRPGVKSLKQLEIEGLYKDDGFMEHWVVDKHGQRIHAHREPHYFDRVLFDAKVKRSRPIFLKSIGYEFVSMLGFGSEAITVKVRKLNLVGDEPEYYAAKITSKGAWGERNKIDAIHANAELRPFIVEVFGTYEYPDHSSIEELLGENAWEKIYKKNDQVEYYYPHRFRSDLKGGVIIMELMEGSLEWDDGNGMIIFKKNSYLQQFRDWLEQAWTAAWENNFIHGDLHLRNILFKRITRNHASFKMADFSESTYPAPNNEETEKHIDAEWRDLQNEIPDEYAISIKSNPYDPDKDFIPFSDTESND